MLSISAPCTAYSFSILELSVFDIHCFCLERKRTENTSSAQRLLFQGFFVSSSC